VAKPTTRKIFIFDCCRGTNKTEMGFNLVVKQDGLEQLKNSDFKNTYVFNTTLPYQVAFVDDITFFAKEWCKLVMLDSPPDILRIDELINAELEKRPADGFKQAVELEKKGIIDAFEWYPKEKNVDDKSPPKRNARKCVIMGDGRSISMDEFYEENDWINTKIPGAFQDDIDEFYSKNKEQPINFLSTFMPKDTRMRLYFSFQTEDGRELVSSTQATQASDDHDESAIPECTICGCKFLMQNVYMSVYEFKSNVIMTKRMSSCFYHFLEEGVDKGRHNCFSG